MRTEEKSLWRPVNSLGENQHRPTSEGEWEEIYRRFQENNQVDEERLEFQKRKEEEEQAELTRIYLELQERIKNAPKPEFDWEQWEKDCKEEDEFDKGVPMYDFGARCLSNEYEIRKEYGWKVAETIESCKFHAEPVPTKLVAEMHRIHEGKPPLQKNPKVVPITPDISQGQKTSKVKWDRTKKKKKPEPTVFMNNRYSHVKAGIFNVARKNRCLQNPTTLLLYLLQNRNWERKKDKHDTYGTWYLKRNLIVASIGVEKMYADLGVSEKTIRNWGNKLERDGLIKKVMEGKENVYVIGEVIDGKELLYCFGEISWKHKPKSVH